jgi:hypothetical protein
MKKIILSGFIFVLFTLGLQAQGLYSDKNLEQSSPEQLDLYLQKAQKVKDTGSIISIVGTASIVIGTGLILSNREAAAYTGIYMFMAGAMIDFVGLPIFFTGSSRVNRINDIRKTSVHGAKMDLTLSSLYNSTTHYPSPALTLRVRF